jgi:hypothetical protein
MRFEVVAEVMVPMLVFWDVRLCGLAGRYRRFGRTYNTEVGDSMFLRNVGFYLQVHLALKQNTSIDDIVFSMQKKPTLMTYFSVACV